MSKSVAIAVHGAGGRMGDAVVACIAEQRKFRLAAALVRPDSALTGMATIVDGVNYAAALDTNAAIAVLIDFSNAAAFDAALQLALERHSAFVSGTTGLDQRQRGELERAAESIPVLWSSSFSLGVAVLKRLVREAARVLPDWDCEIAEAHHRHKLDAPSGTALTLGRAVAQGRDQDFEQVARLTTREGMRREGEIGFAVTRAGDIVGEHRVLFAGSGERLELGHRATDRAIFARGALHAATWLAGRAAGSYTLDDVLGLTEPRNAG